MPPHLARAHPASGMTFLSGAQWEGWNGVLAVGLLKNAAIGERVRLVFLSATGKSVASKNDVATGIGRLRTLVQGPDGNLYIGTDNGQIWKYTPS